MTRVRLAALLMGAALLLGGCSRETAELQGFQGDPASTELTVFYGAGARDGPGEGEILAEDETRIQVRVTFVPTNEMDLNILLRKSVVVTLQSPLGDRKVVDQAGAELPRLR